MKYEIFTDGGARGNPGPGAIGAVIYQINGDNGSRTKLAGFGKTVGKVTNNQAEYLAVIAALEWLTKNNPSGQKPEAKFYLDSLLVSSQISGRFKVKETTLRELLVKVRNLEGKLLGSFTYGYIPREKNWEADLEVNRALDSAR